jgi:hypothetical protein
MGVETRMGVKLHGAFIAAGLPAPSMSRITNMGAADDDDQLHHIVDWAANLLAEMERLGVVTAADVAIDTLFARIRAQAIASNSVMVHYSQVGAWSWT